MKKKLEIERFNPCNDGLLFRKQFATFEEAWIKCPRGDWMLWLATYLHIDMRQLTLAKGYCANTVLHLMNDKASKAAVRLAIKYGKGLIEGDRLQAAAGAAYTVAANAYETLRIVDRLFYLDCVSANAANNAVCSDDVDDAAVNNATAIYNAANAAYATVNMTDDAVYSDDAAADAAYAINYAIMAIDSTIDKDIVDAARKKNQLQTADICRTYLTQAVFEKLLINK